MVTSRILDVAHSDSSNQDDSEAYGDVNEAVYVPSWSKQVESLEIINK